MSKRSRAQLTYAHSEYPVLETLTLDDPEGYQIQRYNLNNKTNSAAPDTRRGEIMVRSELVSWDYPSR